MRAITTVTPMTTASSRLSMPSKSRLPMPGQPNTRSTTTEPPMMWGMWLRMVVSTGSSDPRKAWRTITAPSFRPLARAVRM